KRADVAGRVEIRSALAYGGEQPCAVIRSVCQFKSAPAPVVCNIESNPAKGYVVLQARLDCTGPTLHDPLRFHSLGFDYGGVSQQNGCLIRWTLPESGALKED